MKKNPTLREEIRAALKASHVSCPFCKTRTSVDELYTEPKNREELDDTVGQIMVLVGARKCLAGCKHDLTGEQAYTWES